VTLEVDLLLDRRRLKRRLVFWRTFAVLAVAAALLVATRGGTGGLPVGGAHVARLPVTGLITEDRKLTRAIDDLASDTSVKALIVSIDSPGGTVSGGESLHNAIARVAAKKPVVAVMGGVAASAGYMVAVSAERIFARESTLTGSIGVLLETGEVSGLLEKVGISAETIVSGPLKDQPSLTHKLSDRGRDVLQGLVQDMYDQFVGMVATGRHMTPDAVRQVGDGRAYTGRQALGLGLIDQIGEERDARNWLAANKGVPASMPIEDVTTTTLLSRTLATSLGPLFEGIWKTFVSQSVRLDGAWAVWQRTSER
jgi:protease-4